MSDQDKIDDEAVEWFTRLGDRPVSAPLRAEFARWRLADSRHARAFDELEQLWSGLGELGDLRAPSETASAASFSKTRVITGRRALVAGGVGLLLATAIPISLPDGGVAALLADARTGRELRHMRLADGSTVVMDAGTALSVNMTVEKRVVHLVTGRAYFDVRHQEQRPFVVDAGDIQVKDIGTAFEVSRLKSDNRVAVAEGVVDVSRPGRITARLVAGDTLDLAAERPRSEQVAAIASWRAHRLVFENKPLAAVVEELRHYLPGWVILTSPQRGARRLTGSLDAGRPVAALDALAKMADLSVQRLGPVTLLRPR